MTFLSNLPLVQASADIASLLFAFFIVVQILVGVGALPVSILWGGRQTTLTPGLRLASFGAVVVLAIFIYIIRYRAGLIGSVPIPTIVWVSAWVVTAYMALNTLGNFASRNQIERWLFGSLTVILTVMCLIVSLSNVE